MKTKIKQKITKQDIRTSGNAYNALFMIEEISKKITRPLVKINNNKYIRL